MCFLKSCRPTAFKVFLFVFSLFFPSKLQAYSFLRIFPFFFSIYFLKSCRPTAFYVFFFFTLSFFFVMYSFFPATMVIEYHGHCTKKTHVTFSLNSIIEMATGFKCNRLMHRYSTAILIISHSLATS